MTVPLPLLPCRVCPTRYDVTACPTKVVPGQYGFVAQLNEGRYSKKRPTEFRVDQVVQVRGLAAWAGAGG